MRENTNTRPAATAWRLRDALKVGRELAEDWASAERVVPGGAIMRRATETLAQGLMRGRVLDDVAVRAVAREAVAAVAKDGTRRDRERANELLVIFAGRTTHARGR